MHLTEQRRIKMKNEVTLYNEKPEANAELLPERTRDLGLLFRNMFGIVDFDPLFESVRAIAESSGQLSEEEGKSAQSTLHEWESSVIGKIDERLNFMTRLINLFKNPIFSKTDFSIGEFGITEEMAENLAQSTSTGDSYLAFTNARDILNDLRDSTPVEPDGEDPDITEANYKEALGKYNYDMEIHKIKVLRQTRTTQTMFQTWIFAMKDHEHVQDMLAVAKKYRATAKDLKDQCKGLSLQGRLSISVKSPDTRDALLKMLAFSRKM